MTSSWNPTATRQVTSFPQETIQHVGRVFACSILVSYIFVADPAVISVPLTVQTTQYTLSSDAFLYTTKNLSLSLYSNILHALKPSSASKASSEIFSSVQNTGTLIVASALVFTVQYILLSADFLYKVTIFPEPIFNETNILCVAELSNPVAHESFLPIRLLIDFIAVLQH